MNALRIPSDALAGCIWLPRFVDKCRLHLGGTLPPDYQIAFCSLHGIDVIVLSQFGITATDALQSTQDMNTIEGYCLITPDDLAWRPSNLMRIPNADYLERTGSENLGARLWRFPPQSANTLHRHIRSEEFYFVLEGTGRIRVGDKSLTVPRYGGVLIAPDQLRQVFNDTDQEVLWLIIGAPEELDFIGGSKSKTDLSMFYPTDPTQLPEELNGVTWPPKDATPSVPLGAQS